MSFPSNNLSLIFDNLSSIFPFQSSESDSSAMKSAPEPVAVPPAAEEEQGGGGDDSLLMFTEEDDEEFDPLKRTGSLSQRTNSLSAANKPTPPMAAAKQRTQAPPLIPSNSSSSIVGSTPTGSGGSGLLGDLSGLDLSSGAQQQPPGGGVNSLATSSMTNTVASLQEMLEPLQASSTLAGSQQPAMLTSATPLTQQTAQIQVCDHNLL